MLKYKSKLMVIIFSVLLCVGCSPSGSENDSNPEKTYRTIIIEGHEYIFISRRPWASNMAITHKGNCKAH